MTLVRFGIAIAAVATLLGAAPQPFGPRFAPEVGQLARPDPSSFASRTAPTPTANVLARVSEDRARLMESAALLHEINLGATAIGTGMSWCCSAGRAACRAHPTMTKKTTSEGRRRRRMSNATSPAPPGV